MSFPRAARTREGVAPTPEVLSYTAPYYHYKGLGMHLSRHGRIFVYFAFSSIAPVKDATLRQMCREEGENTLPLLQVT
jgi:hypothetical protein